MKLFNSKRVATIDSFMVEDIVYKRLRYRLGSLAQFAVDLVGCRI